MFRQWFVDKYMQEPHVELPENNKYKLYKNGLLLTGSKVLVGSVVNGQLYYTIKYINPKTGIKITETYNAIDLVLDFFPNTSLDEMYYLKYRLQTKHLMRNDVYEICDVQDKYCAYKTDVKFKKGYKGLGERRCHDCGKITTNYRCDECWAKRGVFSREVSPFEPI